MTNTEIINKLNEMDFSNYEKEEDKLVYGWHQYYDESDAPSWDESNGGVTTKEEFISLIKEWDKSGAVLEIVIDEGDFNVVGTWGEDGSREIQTITFFSEETNLKG